MAHHLDSQLLEVGRCLDEDYQTRMMCFVLTGTESCCGTQVPCDAYTKVGFERTLLVIHFQSGGQRKVILFRSSL